MIRICDSGDVEGDDYDGNDDKDDNNEDDDLSQGFPVLLHIDVNNKDDKDDNNEDDLSQGFPVLLHPFWSTSSSQLLIPGYNFMSSDYIQ